MIKMKVFDENEKIIRKIVQIPSISTFSILSNRKSLFSSTILSKNLYV